MIDLSLAEQRQVVAAAEPLAGALDDDHVHRVLGIGPLDRRADLARHVVVDRVQAFRPVQQQARDARLRRVGVDPQGAVAGHARSSVSAQSSHRCLSSYSAAATQRLDWRHEH
jgi:hypothetical protein